MNRLRSILLCTAALAAALLGTEAIRSASTILWEPASTGLPLTGAVRDVAFGDVNNDGKPELIAAFSGGTGLAIYTRGGLGDWSSAVITTAAYDRLAIGDFNGDGKPDIFVSRVVSPGVAAWLGDGTGGWTAAPNLSWPTGYRGVASGDTDGDGKPELVVAVGTGPGVQVFDYGPLNYFVFGASVTTTGTYQEIAVGYVNEDPYVDVAATRVSGGIQFWRGASSSTWISASAGLPTSGVFQDVAFGDVDNDGKLELLATRAGVAGGGMVIYDFYELSYPGYWTLAPLQVPGNTGYGRLALGDLNVDGWLDILVGSHQDSPSTYGLYTWLGGPYTFTAGTRPTTNGALQATALADFDLNGLLDVAAGDDGGLGTSAWRNGGITQMLGTWREIPSPAQTGAPQSVGYGDLGRSDPNHSGNLDVVLPAAAGLEGFQGDGGSSWSSCPGVSKAVKEGDFTEILMGVYPQVGQDPTIFAARASGGITMVHGVTCAGGGGVSVISSTGSYRGLSAGDIFHDGKLSLVAAPSVVKGGLKLWQWSAGTWSKPVSLAISATVQDTALGDVDRDGQLEIATADSGGAGVSVYDINTSGTTWLRGTLTATGEYYAVGIGDINNDGDLDVVGAKNGADTGIDVWIGAGSSITWTRHDGPDTLGQYYALDLADFNHDGNLDILAARDGEGVMVWAGNGAGVWTPANANLPTTGVFYSASFGHIDHDGNLDILATQAGGGLRMWMSTEADVYRVYLPIVFRAVGGQ
jgi:hypothetical protein